MLRAWVGVLLFVKKEHSRPTSTNPFHIYEGGQSLRNGSTERMLVVVLGSQFGLTKDETIQTMILAG